MVGPPLPKMACSARGGVTVCNYVVVQSLLVVISVSAKTQKVPVFLGTQKGLFVCLYLPRAATFLVMSTLNQLVLIPLVSGFA